MANTSGDLALEKIAGTDKAKLFPTPFNQNMEDIDEAVTDLKDEKAGSSEIGIVVNGNKTAFPTGAANGQFVILRNSTITGCDDGLYRAAKVIPYDTVIDSTYLTPCPEGAANALNASLTAFSPSSFTQPTINHSNVTIGAGGYVKAEKLVVVSCRMSVSANIAPASAIVQFPGYSVNAASVSVTNNKKLDMTINADGYLTSSETVTSGTLVVSCAYFAI